MGLGGGAGVRDRAFAGIAADRLLANRARALRCLVPMTALMVIYTIVSLQILAEPLVRYSGPQETII